MNADARDDRDPVEHLWTAAHEFLQAMRKLVDAADEFVTEQREKPRVPTHEPRLHRIDIDDDIAADAP